MVIEHTSSIRIRLRSGRLWVEHESGLGQVSVDLGTSLDRNRAVFGSVFIRFSNLDGLSTTKHSDRWLLAKLVRRWRYRGGEIVGGGVGGGRWRW